MPTDHSPDAPATATPGSVRVFDIRHLPAELFAKLGVAQVAYVRPVMMNGVRVFAVHAADGTPMAVADDRDAAFAAIRDQELLPAPLH